MTVKSSFESLLFPFASRLPVGPNVLTLFSVVVMAAAAWLVVFQSFAVAAALVLLSGFLDMLDGTVAKAKRRETAFGAFLDRVADRASDALIFGSVVFAGLVQLWLGLVVLILVMLGSYASACLEAATRTRVGEALSMRAVRLIVLVVALLAGNFVLLPKWFDYVFAAILAISAYAFAQRMRVAWKILK